MYRSRLVPRFIPVLGLVGGPLTVVSAITVLLGLIGQYTPLSFLAALPELAWELSLAIRLIAWGFNSSALASESAREL